MSSPSAEWHLLFGLLALQNGVISRQQLVAAFAKWTSEKSLPLDQILVADQAIKPSVGHVLRQLVEIHIQNQGGDSKKSLLALSGSDLPDAKAELARLDDADLHQSIALVPGHDSAATVPQSMGQATSSGTRFRVLRPLPGGEGGMGQISVATDEELGRQVALKQIRIDKADDEYFRRKFQVAGWHWQGSPRCNLPSGVAITAAQPVWPLSNRDPSLAVPREFADSRDPFGVGWHWQGSPRCKPPSGVAPTAAQPVWPRDDVAIGDLSTPFFISFSTGLGSLVEFSQLGKVLL